jgi:hypothetical protein
MNDMYLDTSRDIAYTVGRLHGLRNMSAYPLFPEGTWEAMQYRQGYIDGAVALENDIERETKCLVK